MAGNYSNGCRTLKTVPVTAGCHDIIVQWLNMVMKFEVTCGLIGGKTTSDPNIKTQRNEFFGQIAFNRQH